MRVGHSQDCGYRTGPVLAGHELAVWLSAFGATGSTEAADERVDLMRGHLAGDAPSKLKDPTYVKAAEGERQ